MSPPPLDFADVTGLTVFCGPVDQHRDSPNSLHALTGTGWQHLPLPDVHRSGIDQDSDVLHAVRLMIASGGRVPAGADTRPVTGIRALAWYMGVHGANSIQRILYTADNTGQVLLVRRCDDDPPVAAAPGSPDTVAEALAALAHTWSDRSPQVFDLRTAIARLATSADTFTENMPPPRRHWCVAVAAYLLSTAAHDEHRREDRDEMRIAASAVSQRLSTAVEDGLISVDDAQTIVGDLQLPPLSLLYTVRLLIPVNVDVRAEGEDAAVDAARERVIAHLPAYLAGDDEDLGVECDTEAAAVRHVHGPR